MKPGTGQNSAGNCIAGTPPRRFLPVPWSMTFRKWKVAVRVNWPDNTLFSVGEKRIMVQGNIVDSAFPYCIQSSAYQKEIRARP